MPNRLSIRWRNASIIRLDRALARLNVGKSKDKNVENPKSTLRANCHNAAGRLHFGARCRMREATLCHDANADATKLSLGIPHPGGGFHKSFSDKDVSIFVVSGRNLKDHDDNFDPFGKQRNHRPELGIARVRIAAGMEVEDFLRETTQHVRRLSLTDA